VALVSADPAAAPPTPAALPQQVLHRFTAAICAGDLRGASACLHRDVCLLTPDATIVRGDGSIRALLRQMTTAETRVEFEVFSTVCAEDLALLRGSWRTLMPDATGRLFAQETAATMALRRTDQDDWKLQILAPWEGRSRGKEEAR
jgi:ketosteroid isomerase-like protein